MRVAAANSKTMRRTVFIAFFLHLLLSNHASAFVCSCADPLPPTKELKKASAVFVGTVIDRRELTPASGLTEGKYLFAVRFRVEHYWKGISSSEITIKTNIPLGDCAYLNFEEGKKYLVYAFGKKRIAYGCRRNRRIEGAAQDIKELGKWKVTTNRGRGDAER